MGDLPDVREHWKSEVHCHTLKLIFDVFESVTGVVGAENASHFCGESLWPVGAFYYVECLGVKHWSYSNASTRASVTTGLMVVVVVVVKGGCSSRRKVHGRQVFFLVADH